MIVQLVGSIRTVTKIVCGHVCCVVYRKDCPIHSWSDDRTVHRPPKCELIVIGIGDCNGLLFWPPDQFWGNFGLFFIHSAILGPISECLFWFLRIWTLKESYSYWDIDAWRIDLRMFQKMKSCMLWIVRSSLI